ncbi:hypothetical protein DFO60_4810 [Ectopseudomonas oleovorans]|uniref:Uncharacterized protein n=1 Tax=Ectopseudomonas oleovorans TaxID=301 RepID=A0A3D9E9D0_ECTOL|nr:hypothetical protein DFO60_4810 [Pseudomonas oleovorans]
MLTRSHHHPREGRRQSFRRRLGGNEIYDLDPAHIARFYRVDDEQLNTGSELML